MHIITTEKLTEIHRNPDFLAALHAACAPLSAHGHSTDLDINPDGTPYLLLGWYAFTGAEIEREPPPAEELASHKKAWKKQEKEWLKKPLPPLPRSFMFQNDTIPLKHITDTLAQFS